MTQMTESSEPLEELIVDEQELNERLLTEVLSEYVRIGGDSGSLYPRESFDDLISARKTAVVLLAQHAKSGLGMAESEWMTPSDIVSVSGMKKGTVHPKVRELVEQGLAEGDDGSYRIPAPGINEVKEFNKGGSD